ncbi:MAG: YiiD C-terminal domain-containing protein [Flavobacteriales bacterium]|nr:YiiD C-terminal domain-containing protein [Flavobacteriales bacterium]
MTNKQLRKANWQLFLFGLAKIPLVRFVRPRIIELTDKKVSIKIPMKRRNRNHVNSMYLGVLTVGADLACGFLTFYKLEKSNIKAPLVFKSMKAEYLKRAEADVYFDCSDGEMIDSMLSELQNTQDRINQMLKVNAYCNGELVATFDMEVSLKMISRNK